MTPADSDALPDAGDTAVIVLLAAGRSHRFGSPKQLALIDGEPMLRRVARTALATQLPVFVVLGAQAALVSSALDDLPVSIIPCADWAAGMGCSLATGLRAVMQQVPRASGVLLCLADQPLIDTPLLLEMLRRHHAAPQKILANGHQGGFSPPVIFPRDCFAELAHWSGEDGARALLQREARRVERILVEVGIDVDTPAALDHVQRVLTLREAARKE